MPLSITTSGYSTSVSYPSAVCRVDDNHVVVGGQDGVAILNVSNPSLPYITGTKNSNTNNITSIAMSGTNVAVATDSTNNRLWVLDLTSRTTPVVLGSYTSATNLPSPRVVSVLNNIAVVGCGSNTLTVLNVADPYNPTYQGKIVSSTYFSLPDGVAMFLSGATVYAAVSAGDYRVTTVNLSNPASPTVSGSLFDTFYFDGVRELARTKDSGHVVVVNEYNETLCILDVASNPASPSFVGFAVDSRLAGATAVDVLGDYAIISAYTTDTVTTLDLHNLTAPSIKSSVTSTGLDTVNDVAAVTRSVAVSVQSLSGKFATLSADLNTAPAASTLNTPTPGQSIDKDTTQRFLWTFNDVDTDQGDQQSAYSLRYRTIGAPSWTTVTGGATSYRDFPSGTFTAGNYEWQVQTTDNMGAVGSWSSTQSFTAASVPADLTITDPTNESTIPASTYVVKWTAANQDAYEVRRVADNAGSADTGTIYWTSGEVTSTNRQHSVPFPENGRYEHVQARIKLSGLWSAWSSVRVSVSYTTPAVPVLSVQADSPTAGAIRVSATHPTPTGTQPTVTSVDLWRRETSDEESAIRIRADVTPSLPLDVYTARSGVSYEFMVVAHGSNSTSVESAWAG